MKQKIVFLSCLVVIAIAGFAQEKSKLKFISINQVGVLSGESPTEFQAQTINGISYKDVSVGAGVGIDNYSKQTVPVFIDVRKKLFNKTGSFVFGDAGYSIPVKNSFEEFETDRKGGIYYAIGVGYELPIDKKVSAIFDIGYSYKLFSRIIDSEPWRSSVHSFSTYDYSLNRISVKAGLRF